MRHDTGAALISVLMVVVVFLLLGTALLQWTAVEAIQVQRQEKQLQAHYLARSGLEVALSYVFEQVAQGFTVKDLKLSKLDGSLAEAGSYDVTFSRDSEEGSVEINAKGYVTGPVTAEETIRCKVYLESLLGEADRAEKIDPAWASLHNSGKTPGIEACPRRHSFSAYPPGLV
jgi:type II secretory pathway component PulK